MILLLAAAILGAILLVNLRTYAPGDLSTVRAQLRFLQSSLREGGADRMQRLFPEGYVFSWTLYGLASAQVAAQLDTNDPARADLLAETSEALRRVRSDVARSTFPRELKPEYGAFYSSWSLYLLAEYIRAAGPGRVSAELRSAFREECARFAAALAESDTPFLESYPYLAWPADTAVGIAALGIHDAVFGAAYADVIARWLADALAEADPTLGALGHEAGPRSAARGSSLALMSRVLIDADSAIARQQYQLLRSHFVAYRLGAPGVREYPHGMDGDGDVDSGPLLNGFSGPAVVVGAAAARAHGDPLLADVLMASVEAVGFPVQWSGQRRYVGGGLPLGDAFIAWARATPIGATESWERIFPPWWRLPAHLVSLLVAVLVLWRARTAWLSAAAARRAGSQPL